MFDVDVSGNVKVASFLGRLQLLGGVTVLDVSLEGTEFKGFSEFEDEGAENKGEVSDSLLEGSLL